MYVLLSLQLIIIHLEYNPTKKRQQKRVVEKTATEREDIKLSLNLREKIETL
jgi:hypothetical protein